jgi:hypothetical protein
VLHFFFSASFHTTAIEAASPHLFTRAKMSRPDFNMFLEQMRKEAILLGMGMKR